MRGERPPLTDDVPQLRIIDLAPEQQGSLCLLCDAFGNKVTAQLLDKAQGPVCVECFFHLVNLEAQLVFAAYAERQRAQGKEPQI